MIIQSRLLLYTITKEKLQLMFGKGMRTSQVFVQGGRNFNANMSSIRTPTPSGEIKGIASKRKGKRARLHICQPNKLYTTIRQKLVFYARFYFCEFRNYFSSNN